MTRSTTSTLTVTADMPNVLHNDHDPEKIPKDRAESSFPLPGFDDPNLDTEETLHADDDSPYPEVRCAVANTDDTAIPVSTVRSWVLGITWSILIAGLNQIFSFRYPSVKIGGIVAQLLSYPIGRAWARYIPNVTILDVPLNPGPFSIKEHVLITIMASVGSNPAPATDVIATQRVYYNQIYHFGFQWMVVMSTQMIGLSICGVCHRYLVDPPSMVWPANLVTCTLFNTLQSQKYAGMGDRKGMSRQWFFLICFVGSAVYYSSIMRVIRLFVLCAGNESFHGGQRQTLWRGFVFFYWFLTPILYHTNAWNSQYMPIWARGSFDNTGKAYNITRIINADASLNVDGYKAYSPDGKCVIIRRVLCLNHCDPHTCLPIPPETTLEADKTRTG